MTAAGFNALLFGPLFAAAVFGVGYLTGWRVGSRPVERTALGVLWGYHRVLQQAAQDVSQQAVVGSEVRATVARARAEASEFADRLPAESRWVVDEASPRIDDGPDRDPVDVGVTYLAMAEEIRAKLERRNSLKKQ